MPLFRCLAISNDINLAMKTEKLNILWLKKKKNFKNLSVNENSDKPEASCSKNIKPTSILSNWKLVCKKCSYTLIYPHKIPIWEIKTTPQKPALCTRIVVKKNIFIRVFSLCRPLWWCFRQKFRENVVGYVSM